MSKGEGKKIVVQFTEELNEIISVDTLGDAFKPIGTPSHSSSAYEPLYGANKVFDNDIGTFWTPSLTANSWVQIGFSTPQSIGGCKMLCQSNRPKDIQFLGSVDGITWVEISTGVYDNTTGWKEFYWDSVNYKFYRWKVVSTWGLYVYIHEIMLYPTTPGNTEKTAFILTGQKQKYIGSDEFVAETYIVDTVENHPTLDTKHLLLTINQYPTIKNSTGLVTVAYDKTKGTLAGEGGVVESFITTFTPTDLSLTPNPHIEERLTLLANITALLKIINYLKCYHDDRLEVSASVSTVLTYIEEENP